ncbi:MAG TPA: hypothetical protein VFA98_13060 [Thermoanaerobaculia bacterium]|jgi:hypothetical protein|nr:hypothetical protein [Thermoanaerobaculia bacterium]
MDWREKQEAVARTVAEFPGEFGLRAFPGDRFRVSERASYWSDYENRPLLYTERFKDGEWRDFAKGTAEKLRGEMVPLPKAARGRHRFNEVSVVYVAAAWWRNSDPSMGVVATTEKRAEKEIERQMRDAARDARDDGSYRTINAALDDIAWSGVHAEKLGTIAQGREVEDAVADLEENGVWYPPSY